MSDSLPIEDRLAIADLLSAYALLLDQGRLEDWLEVFWPDASMEVPGQPAIHTHQGLREMAAGSPMGTHIAASPLISPGATADEAIVEQAYIFRSSVKGWFSSGWYEDRVAKRDGRWRIISRRVNYARRPPRSPS